MNNQDWITDHDWQDSKAPIENLEGEKAYTLFLKDFLTMPTVNFSELSEIDPDVQALLN